MGEVLRDRAVAVTGAGTPLVDGITEGLRAAGARVGVLDGTGPWGASREAAEAAVAGLAADLGPLAGVVHGAIDPIAFDRVPFQDVDDARWEAVWEQTLRRTLFVFQAAFGHLHERGGAIVVLTPVVSMAGAAQLGPLTAAVEGIRILAKAAARQWGPHGIRVNCLAPAPEHLPIGMGSRGLALAPPALGGPGDPARDLGPIVAWLLGDDAHFLTGVTLCADGGVWMAP